MLFRGKNKFFLIFIPFLLIFLMSHNTYAADLQTSSFDLYYRANNNSSYGWRNNITYGSNSPTVIDSGGGITRYQFNTPSVQAGGNYATIHFETNIVASPYALVNNFNPWVNLPQQNILTCSASGIAVVSKNLSYATTYWVDQNNESNNTLTFYGDVVLSGFNPGSSYSLVCSIGSSSYSFIDYNGAAVWFEQNPMSIVWSNDESLALMQTQIEQQTTIINQNETIINNQNQNTQEQIESQKVCNNVLIDKNDIVQNGYFNSNGTIANSDSYGITNYIDVENMEIEIISSGYGGVYSLFYNKSKEVIGSILNTDIIDSITLPSGTNYMRFTIRFSQNKPQILLKSCKNGNQALYDQQRQADDNISNQSSSDINGAENQATTNLIGVLSSFLTQLQSFQPTNCNLSLPFPQFIGGTQTVNICQGKDVLGNFITIIGTLAMVTFYIPLALVLLKMIYNEIRSFTNG